MLLRSKLTIGALLLATLGVRSEAADAVSFLTEVRPIIEHACVRCHGPEKSKGDFQMHTRELLLKGGGTGPAVVVGKSDKSKLIKLVRLPEDHDDVMPNKGRHLTEKEIDMLKRWVDGGLYWTEGVVLMDRSAKTPPPPKGNAHNRHNLERKLSTASSRQLDTLIEEKNTQHEGLLYADALNDLGYLRKISIELIGRIPTTKEIARYQRWPEAERRQKALEELLAHPRFTDRWTAFYADMMRIRTGNRGGSGYERYIRQCVEQGVPYDLMVKELLSAQGDPKFVPAVGYILRDNVEPMALAAATSQVFLGVRMSCAQCHDHPFDKWSQKQFYEFAGFFGKSRTVRKRRSRREVFTTEGENMTVQWPPADPADNTIRREPVHPTFPFGLETSEKPMPHIARFEARRALRIKGKQVEDPELEELNDMFAEIESPPKEDDVMLGEMDVMGTARAQAAKLADERNWYKQSELRSNLAAHVTSPHNRFFSRAIVNRVWAELMGRGFYEPIDDYRDDTMVSHPAALEYLADEFVASGFELRQLIRMIMGTRAYQRGHLSGPLDPKTRQESVEAFAAAPLRRMISEALFDSMVVAGHMEKPKWPGGANMKERERRIRYFVEVEPSTNDMVIAEAELAEEPEVMTNEMEEVSPEVADGVVAALGGGEDELMTMTDSDSAMLETADASEAIASMMAMTGGDMMAQKIFDESVLAQQGRRVREKYRTVVEKYDDNPSFGSSFHMGSPAPNNHFLRVFGQPPRDRLGEFRSQSASMRQELMLLNGRVSNEAARVGPYEPMYKMLNHGKPDVPKAIDLAYREILTRKPEPEEIDVAKAIVADAENPLDGMADLRWALMNSHEFRFMP